MFFFVYAHDVCLKVTHHIYIDARKTEMLRMRMKEKEKHQRKQQSQDRKEKNNKTTANKKNVGAAGAKKKK